MVVVESFPSEFCRGVRTYWRRRKYQRLEYPAKKPGRVARLGAGSGSGSGSSRRLWRLRRAFRFRIKIWSPARFMARLRDAYVDGMLWLAGKGNGLSLPVAREPLWNRRIPQSRPVRTTRSEFEQRLIIEIYKSLVAAREIAAA